MIFIVGGRTSGKLEVAKKIAGADAVIYDGCIPESIGGKIIINDLNRWAFDVFKQGEDAPALLTELTAESSECIIISDEIGCGIVPVDKTERDFREWMGRLQIEIAKQAASVYRVYCGIEQRIK